MKKKQMQRPTKQRAVLPTTGRAAYFDALQRIFALEAEILTVALPHAGERGRNDEERTRAFLTRVLPRRFSVGTGFILSAKAGLPASRQNDIVIFDETYNAPLHRELAALVFPIESVYGIVEVKGTLRQQDLRPALENIAEVRRLAKKKVFVQYGNVQLGEPGQNVVSKVEITSDQAPRAYIFAYDAAWASVETFSAALIEALKDVSGAHLHGVVVLGKDWHVIQQAFRTPPEVSATTDRALLRFTTNMTHGLGSIGMGAASVDRYLAF